MNFIENYYYFIIGIGLFIMFALLGYLVELCKKNKLYKKGNKNNNNVVDNTNNENNIKEIKIEPMDINSEEISIDNDILNK